MAKERGVKLRSVYGVIFSLFSVFVGALFIMQIWSIYRSSPQSPYSVESISKHWDEIALPVWIWLAALLGNILLAFSCPEKETRPKAYIDAVFALSKVKKALPAEGKRLAVGFGSKKQQTFRAIVYAVCTVLMVVAAVFSVLILFDAVYFPLLKSEFFSATNAVADRLVQCVALTLAALTVGCIAAALNQRSRTEERTILLRARLELLKARPTVEKRKEESRFAPAAQAFAKTLLLSDQQRANKAMERGVKEALAPKKEVVIPQEPQPVKEKKTCKKCKTMGVWSLRAVIFVAAVFLIIVGVQNGGMKEVLLKAINICTQCIGLG